MHAMWELPFLVCWVWGSSRGQQWFHANRSQHRSGKGTVCEDHRGENNAMTMTHQSTYDSQHFDVRAWQFSWTEAMPVWVFRTFHRLGERAVWTKIALDGTVVEARETDWAVCLDESICVVLTNDEFIRCFRKL